jgi:hypothetical protein
VTRLTRRVATGLAILLAATSAWGHTFPPMRTVVLQVERCELVVMVGYRPGSGEATDAILGRVASQPKSQMLDTLRGTMSAYAMAPLTVAVDGKPLVPTTVRAKIGVDDGGTRPIVVVLVTYPLPTAGRLSITTKDPRTTRISWTDRDSRRVDPAAAPKQGIWHAGVASFLLSLAAPTGDMACAPSQPSD